MVVFQRAEFLSALSFAIASSAAPSAFVPTMDGSSNTSTVSVAARVSTVTATAASSLRLHRVRRLPQRRLVRGPLAARSGLGVQRAFPDCSRRSRVGPSLAAPAYPVPLWQRGRIARHQSSLLLGPGPRSPPTSPLLSGRPPLLLGLSNARPGSHQRHS